MKEGDFLDIPMELHRATFDSIVVPSLVLVKLMVEKFIQRKNGLRSGLINVTNSPSYYNPIPGKSTFAASKAY